VKGMSRLKRVLKLIEKTRDEGNVPTQILMSLSFASALKNDLMPEIDKYFINGRMEIDGVPWGIEKIRGFRVVYFPKAPESNEYAQRSEGRKEFGDSHE
jgi:hypothetical protein